MATYRDVIHRGFRSCPEHIHKAKATVHRHCWCKDGNKHPGCYDAECSLCVRYQRHRDALQEVVVESGDLTFHLSELAHIMGM